MSRQLESINKNITVAHGSDHALGQFFDVMDKRYADSGKDDQGEGYVFEHSTLFGSDNNHIDLDIEHLRSLDTKDKRRDYIIERCDTFAKTLNNESTDKKKDKS